MPVINVTPCRDDHGQLRTIVTIRCDGPDCSATVENDPRQPVGELATWAALAGWGIDHPTEVGPLEGNFWFHDPACLKAWADEAIG